MQDKNIQLTVTVDEQTILLLDRLVARMKKLGQQMTREEVARAALWMGIEPLRVSVTAKELKEIERGMPARRTGSIEG